MPRAASSNGTPPAAPPAAYEEVPGPRNAFVPGQESESRRQLFNRISPVYDEVRVAGWRRWGPCWAEPQEARRFVLAAVPGHPMANS